MLDMECERLRFTAFGEIWKIVFGHFFTSVLNARYETCTAEPGAVVDVDDAPTVVVVAPVSPLFTSPSRSIISSARDIWRCSSVLPFTGDVGVDSD